MAALITGKLPNELKINSVKRLTQSVYFNYWSITDWTQNQLSKIYNIECLI